MAAARPTCPLCDSERLTLRRLDRPDVVALECRRCGHEWHAPTERYSAEALERLAPLPHWR